MAKGKGGRPRWSPDAETLQNVEKYASRFLKEEQIAILIGIAPGTFVEKKKEFPELNEAIKKGRAKVSINLANKMYEQAMKGNTTMLIFLAKSVIGLKENDPMVQENITFNVHTSKGSERIQFS